MAATASHLFWAFPEERLERQREIEFVLKPAIWKWVSLRRSNALSSPFHIRHICRRATVWLKSVGHQISLQWIAPRDNHLLIWICHTQQAPLELAAMLFGHCTVWRPAPEWLNSKCTRKSQQTCHMSIRNQSKHFFQSRKIETITEMLSLGFHAWCTQMFQILVIENGNNRVPPLRKSNGWSWDSSAFDEAKANDRRRASKGWCEELACWSVVLVLHCSEFLCAGLMQQLQKKPMSNNSTFCSSLAETVPYKPSALWLFCSSRKYYHRGGFFQVRSVRLHRVLEMKSNVIQCSG